MLHPPPKPVVGWRVRMRDGFDAGKTWGQPLFFILAPSHRWGACPSCQRTPKATPRHPRCQQIAVPTIAARRTNHAALRRGHAPDTVDEQVGAEDRSVGSVRKRRRSSPQRSMPAASTKPPKNSQINVLAEIKDERHPRIQQLRAAIKRWEKSLSFWQWLNWRTSWIEPTNRPVTIDFLPGELEDEMPQPETPLATSASSHLGTAV